ncbi:MAG: AAA family ATPase [Muribaculaceae bacterium]|nr:AAA family ATPase [Muribaculaceae bacterium]
MWIKIAKFVVEEKTGMKFSEIPGNESTKQRMRAMCATGHIPHALLLEGQSGVGKMMLARAFAQYIHCEHRDPDGDACGKCPSCLQHESFNHIDTIFIYPVVKGKSSKALSDDYAADWHEFLRESPWMDFDEWHSRLGSTTRPSIYVEESQELIHKLNFTSHRSQYKIVIVWLPERMNIECANKLLKIIEEPHSDTIFLFVSNNSAEIIPTIYSRCQRIEVKRLSDDVVAGCLTAGFAVDPAEAMSVAHVAEGSMVRAIGAIKAGSESQRHLDLFMRLMRLAYMRDVKNLKEWSATTAKLSREELLSFLTYCERMVRENFILNLHDTRLNYLNSAEAAFSAKFSPFINERNVMKIIEVINEAVADVSGNANARIVLFDVAIKMILLIKQ